jgi:hypothetical protein
MQAILTLSAPVAAPTMGPPPARDPKSCELARGSKPTARCGPEHVVQRSGIPGPGQESATFSIAGRRITRMTFIADQQQIRELDVVVLEDVTG